MITLAQLTELLGLASIINIAFLLLTSITLVLMRDPIASIHSKMLGVPEKDLPVIYMKYLASYKTLTFIFIIAPYLALKLMGQ